MWPKSGVVYILDYEVVPCSSKICDWLLNSSHDHFGEEKRKNDHWTWGLEKAYFHAYIVHCHGPTIFDVGEAKEVLLQQRSGDHSIGTSFWSFFIFLILFCRKILFIVMRKEGKKKKKGDTRKKIPKMLFLEIYKKFAHPLLLHGHFSWSTFSLHLIRGPHALRIFFFFRNQTT